MEKGGDGTARWSMRHSRRIAQAGPRPVEQVVSRCEQAADIGSARRSRRTRGKARGQKAKPRANQSAGRGGLKAGSAGQGTDGSAASQRCGLAEPLLRRQRQRWRRGSGRVCTRRPFVGAGAGCGCGCASAKECGRANNGDCWHGAAKGRRRSKERTLGDGRDERAEGEV